jgi:hypothetical protein
MTPKDLQLALETLGLDDNQLYTAIGRTIQTHIPESSDDDEEQLVRQAPVIGMRRGGALTG